MATAANPLEGIQQDKDGNFFDTVDLGDGSGPQVFKGKTVAELLGKYRQAQAHATRKIREQALALKLRDTPDPARPMRDYTRHVPTTDEMWKLRQDLDDAAKAPSAIARAVEWELGASADEVREVLQNMIREQRRRQIFSEAELFKQDHPEFKETVENEKAMFTYMDNHGMDYTKKNFEIAFGELKSGLVLISPGAPPTGSEQGNRIETTVTTRPRAASSGLSPRTSSAVPPRENTAMRPTKLTAADIDAMPTAEYERKLRDPAFAAEAERVLTAANNPRR